MQSFPFVFRKVQTENCKVNAEDVWSILEQHARDTAIIVDNFDEDQCSDELRQVQISQKFLIK